MCIRDSLETVRELKSLGVDVFFEEQNIHTMSADGELMLTILASYAQEESRSVSENQKWRVKRNFEAGIPWNGRMPVSYTHLDVYKRQMENEAVPQEQMERRVTETAKALHIENLLGRNIFALSGGEKQKIAFASVYAMNPEVYLLDEPSSNLDMTAIGELRDHLQLIKSQGKTVIIAEHRLYYRCV